MTLDTKMGGCYFECGKLNSLSGCVTFEKQPFRNIAGVVVTGPRRHLMAQSGVPGYIEAAPGGDMMMTGPLGLLRGLSLLLEGSAP